MSLLILITSIVVQFSAAGVALWQVRKSGRRGAWLVVAAALFFMGVRRAIAYAHIVSSWPGSVDPVGEGMALLVSLLMLIGVWRVGDFFDESNRLRVEAEEELARRRRAEQELEALERQESLVLDNTVEIIAHYDTDLTVQWANEAYLRETGKTLAEVQGTKCYEARGYSEMCEACPVPAAIETRRPQEAELSPQTQQHWPVERGCWLARAAPVTDEEGRVTGAVEVAHDITERQEAKQALQYRLEFEELISRLSTEFINVPLDSIDLRIREALASVGQFVEADRAYVFQFNEQISTMSNTHEWCAEGIAPQIDNLQDLPADTLPWWVGKLRDFEPIHLKTLEDLPAEAGTEREVLEAQDIQSLVVVPMVYEKELVGFIGFDAVREPMDWSEDTISLLQTAGEILVSALQRRRTELALHSSEEKYRRMFELSPEAIVLIDSDGTVLDVNDRVKDWLEYGREEVIGKRLLELPYLPPESKKEIGKRFAERMEGKEASPYELDFVSKGGERVTGLVHATPLTDRHGNVYADLVLIADISERKKAQKELEQMRDRLLLAMDAAEHAFWDWDLQTNDFYFSPRYYTMLGYEPGELSMRLETWIELMHPEDREAVVPEVKRHVRNAEPYEVEFRLRCKDGSWKWISGRGKSYDLTEDGRPDRAVGVHVDIDGRKRAAEALRENREKLAGIVAASTDPMSMVDENHNIVWVNNVARELFGSGLVGQRCYSAFHGNDEVCEPCIVGMTFADGETHEHFKEMRDINGEKKIFWCTASVAAKHKDGSPKHVLEILRDITERERHQKELEELNEELERSNQDLQDFTYTVSHDLQAPLRKVHTFGKFLEEDCGEILPQEGLEHLHRMQDAAVRMKQLIQHLLKLSRVKTRGADLAPVDPAPVVQQVREDFSEKIKELNATITIQDDLPPVMADKIQLEQVVLNLIGNALKYRHEERPPKIDITGWYKGDNAIFSVKDNGIGIEEPYQEKIFGVFQRLNRREDYEGTGVGLALCEKIVHRHGGQIWVKSRFGEGSTFYFTLQPAIEEVEVGG
jgi:PAS domain S-box-containing protein